MPRSTPHTIASALLGLAAGMLLAACDPAPEGRTALIDSDNSISPPAPGEGAVGLVNVDDAGAAENPVTPALSGGPEGQTPEWGAPGGAPSIVVSDRSSPPSVSSDNAPLPNIAHDGETPAH